MITITENLTTVTISVTQGQVGTQDISGKVDKIVGKGLSTEDHTTAENKISGFIYQVEMLICVYAKLQVLI
jgi:hypothetical protein